jgi:hypothetical protein
VSEEQPATRTATRRVVSRRYTLRLPRPVDVLHLALEVDRRIADVRDFVVLGTLVDPAGQEIDPGDCSWGLSTYFRRPFCYVGDPAGPGLVALQSWRSQAYFTEFRALVRPFSGSSDDMDMFGRLFVGRGFASSEPGLAEVVAVEGVVL